VQMFQRAALLTKRSHSMLCDRVTITQSKCADLYEDAAVQTFETMLLLGNVT